jgi:uncharacterized protein YjiS (DUF1127 family)
MWIENVLKLIWLWVARHTQRNELSEMEDHRLSDIGQSHAEVCRECKKWCWQE